MISVLRYPETVAEQVLGVVNVLSLEGLEDLQPVGGGCKALGDCCAVTTLSQFGRSASKVPWAQGRGAIGGGSP